MIGGLFIDSGAFSLYRRHVAGSRDYSWFSLKPGSEFRAYCDSYAGFVKAMNGKGMWFANVDVISNPDLTWTSQKYFEEEHGLILVPVLHSGASMKYLARYLETGKYEMIGLGGAATKKEKMAFTRWVDRVFFAVCPESNGRKPIIKVHGFGTTSWRYVCRWPWYSVDSTSWRLVAAYGGVYVPSWSENEGFRYDREPHLIGASEQRKEAGKPHITTVRNAFKSIVDLWFKECGVAAGSTKENGEVDVVGTLSCHRSRTKVNLHYLQNLSDSRPPWPYPLDGKVINSLKVEYLKGFEL